MNQRIRRRLSRSNINESQTKSFDRGMFSSNALNTDHPSHHVDAINEKESGEGMRVPRFIKGSRKKEQVGHRPLLPRCFVFPRSKGGPRRVTSSTPSSSPFVSMDARGTLSACRRRGGGEGGRRRRLRLPVPSR